MNFVGSSPSFRENKVSRIVLNSVDHAECARLDLVERERLLCGLSGEESETKFENHVVISNRKLMFPLKNQNRKLTNPKTVDRKLSLVNSNKKKV